MRIKERYTDILEKSDIFFFTFPAQGICLLLYKILVDLVYLLYVGPTFDYGIRINVLDIISSYLYVGIYTIVLYHFVKGHTVSSIMFIVMNMIYLVPITAYCSLRSGSSSFLFYALLYWTLLSALQAITPVAVLKRLEISGRMRSFFMYFYWPG